MRYYNFTDAIVDAQHTLLTEGEVVDTGRWQGYPTQGKPDLMTKEILNLQLEVPVYRLPSDDRSNLDLLAMEIRPNLPWADLHFNERIGGIARNPDPSYVHWPWWQGQESSKQAEGGKFTHTYSERFWPRYAGTIPEQESPDAGEWTLDAHRGIRYEYGDLLDVMRLLLKEPHTRQAYLPIFFPEDTGAIHGGRIPCTLGYHFMQRNDRLHLWYHIRSCDVVRHFRDDLYLACRLMLWALNTLSRQSGDWATTLPGNLYFTAYSFHIHMGDIHHVKKP